ncbi:MAG: TlpA disulfide reductase family protein [Balneolaceae bacterium]|nr:TlpA disulfide reductase family protein [Balneolaceae bacterium]
MGTSKLVGYSVIIITIAFIFGCSSEPEVNEAVINASFTVADSIDSSGDYSGIGLTIVHKDSANASADTLFHAVTDSAGTLKGTARFSERNEYLSYISRNGRNLARVGLILADKDTLDIKAEFPGIEQTFTVSSREHDAMNVYQRVNRSFERVRAFMQAGRVSQDSIGIELQKWSDIYWEVYKDYEGTLASQMGASESIRLLQGWNNEQMMERIKQVRENDDLVGLAATYGKDYLAEQEGLDYAVSYLDTLYKITEGKQAKMQIQMEQIKLLYDSAKVEAAKTRLASFNDQFEGNKQAQDWAENISYDLNYLAPGDTIPSFLFRENGQTISRDSLIGTPYILEITTLSNRLYQQQYDRTVVIHSIYKNYGLQIITLPLEDSQVTVDAFFEERIKPWPVADANAFDRAKLLEDFNIQLIPTRFLIDAEGKIYRKYVGREYQDVIQGIQALTDTERQPS